ncbi:MAG TPA: hypothetical protein DFR83_04070 [Deltaproteobacteria bacterium]|nr:hypothetical protein [Deltaproteobacteria bacterium]
MNKESVSTLVVSILTVGSVMCTTKSGGGGRDTAGTSDDSGYVDACESSADCGDDQTCVDGVCVTDGALRFTLQWDDQTDLDLYVTTPAGNTISYSNRSADGGRLDVDDTRGGANSVENIHFNEDLASGPYEYWVNNYDNNSASWRLSVHVDGSEVAAVSDSFRPEDSDSEHFTFEY